MFPRAAGNRLGCRDIEGLDFFSFFGSSNSFCPPLDGVPGSVKWIVLGRNLLKWFQSVSSCSTTHRESGNDVAATCGSTLQNTADSESGKQKGEHGRMDMKNEGAGGG